LFSDDDDEFYDRTKKKPSQKKPGDNQSIETADTLLDKRDTIVKEMDEKKELLMTEKNKMLSESTTQQAEVDDSLDAYMSGLSSQLGDCSLLILSFTPLKYILNFSCLTFK
jgi:hypothetical protein